MKDFHETWYKYYTTSGHLKFYFLMYEIQ